ncbi:MAG: 1,4-alpha-glucan branching protein GlgB [Clostridia bacterium]|nr:1,4-alpha-glucan branching protein GlgB [Clostridia bacterium]
MDMYGFYTGQSFDAYTFLGAHPADAGWIFRAFAPAAAHMSVLLDDGEHGMERCYDGNFFQVTIPGLQAGDTYEYRVYHRDGGYTDHCDPYGFEMELRPAHRSVLCDLAGFKFHDEAWMSRRSPGFSAPVNIYEMHVGSWRKPGEEPADWYSYDELGSLLVPYMQETGYNCVEFMPISEYPSDESWGYQGTGFFAPTRRYGSPRQLMQLIDTLHAANIAVVLDFVPVHFAGDDYGLKMFDGTALYEYPHGDVGVSEWGSQNFMHSRGEVRSFLQSAANYWMQVYHFDGIRMDAISRIIYWQGDPARGENGNAIDFLRVMTKGLKERNAGCALYAEDSTNYPKVTSPVDDGGLGFDYKWDLGWMHDTLEVLQSDPDQRRDKYHKLTFSMMYYWNEKYILPFSHDEVVHGKATILQKMNGDYEGKFPQGRLLYMYMMVHPGKKLNFMGSEIGQLREWDEKREQDWFLRKYPLHDSFYHYICELNRHYLTNPAFYAEDYSQNGFEWLDCAQEERRLYAILRRGGGRRIAAVFNFSEVVQENFTVQIPEAAGIEVLLYSDWQRFSGATPETEKICSFADGKLTCTLSPFSALLVSVETA